MMRVFPAFDAPRARRPREAATAARDGFTFVELMISAALLAIAAMIALPALRPDDPLKVIGAATMLASDIEFAQSATLASPADPTVVRFSATEPRYWLALASAPETPITRANGEPYEVHFGVGDAQYLQGLTVTLLDDPGGTITFDAFGRLTQFTDAQARVGNTSGGLIVTAKSSTGSISIAE